MNEQLSCRYSLKKTYYLCFYVLSSEFYTRNEMVILRKYVDAAATAILLNMALLDPKMEQSNMITRRF